MQTYPSTLPGHPTKYTSIDVFIILLLYLPMWLVFGIEIMPLYIMIAVISLATIRLTISDFFNTNTPFKISFANEILSVNLPKNLLIYDDENRFGIFTLLFLHYSTVINNSLQVFTSIGLTLALLLSKTIGSVGHFIFVSMNPFNHMKCQNWYTHSEIHNRMEKHKNTPLCEGYLTESFKSGWIRQIENIGISQTSLPIYLTMKTFILYAHCAAIYILTIIQRTLLNCINFIDRHIFSKATLNQDLYWLTIKTWYDYEWFKPIGRAIMKHDIRAMKALMNDPNTDINDPCKFSFHTSLYLAINEQFDDGIELILSDPSYILNPRLPTRTDDAPLKEVLMKLIDRNDRYWLNRILNHDKAKDYEPCHFIINKCIESQFIKAVHLLLEKAFSVSPVFNYLAIFTQDNHPTLVPILQAIDTRVKAKVVNALYNYIYLSSTSLRVKEKKLYLNAILKKDITAPVTAAIGLRREDFDKLCEEEEVLSCLRDMDLIDVATLGIITTIPLKINDEKQFYDQETIENFSTKRIRSPMTREFITKITPAEEEYLEKVILCFLKYAINKNDTIMIEHIKNQKTIKLSDGIRREMEMMIDSHKRNITHTHQSAPGYPHKECQSTCRHTHEGQTPTPTVVPR